MRIEASIGEWKKLYEVATRIKELEPWKLLWAEDIIGIQVGEEVEDTAFYSILGKGESTYGVIVYEGYDAFNSFMMLIMEEELNLSIDYVTFSQKGISCFWGNREDLSANQRDIIKELGYKYRGKNNWQYFLSYEPGYHPYNLNQDEVIRMTNHLENLEMAFLYYKDSDIKVNFDNKKMFSFVYSKDKKTWHYGEDSLPFTYYKYGHLFISDKDILKELKKAPKTRTLLEADVRVMGAKISDNKFDKPANPAMSILMEASMGMIISCEINEPDDDPMIKLAISLIDFILKSGAPKEIKVSNVIVEAALEEICETCKIKLNRVKRLKETDKFLMIGRNYF